MNPKYQEACEALAEQLETAGRLDLASLCDRASYWLDPTAKVEEVPFTDIVASCRETAERMDPEALAVAVVQSVVTLEGLVTNAVSRETAAKLQALAILTSGLFHDHS